MWDAINALVDASGGRNGVSTARMTAVAKVESALRADLRRCRLLMERVPEIAERFPRMASHSLEWAALVARWDALCRMMDEEAPKWRDGTGSASHTYALMSEVIRGARSRESGR